MGVGTAYLGVAPGLKCFDKRAGEKKQHDIDEMDVYK